MQFETSAKAAERLGVTVRAIQKWAKQGRIRGAYFDHSWQIPVDFTEPLPLQEPTEVPPSRHQLLPLLSATYPMGRAKEYVDSITDKDDRNIALVEYYYYLGDTEKAIEIAQQYIDSSDEILRYNACVMCTFANIFQGHIHLAAFFYELVLKEIRDIISRGNVSEENKAISASFANVGGILLHAAVPETPPLEEYLHLLPGGIQLYSAYMLSYKQYTEQNYERAIGICTTALAFCKNRYPIASVYVLMILSASYMAVKQIDLAKKHFIQAWDIARADGFTKLFGIHHRLLQGLTEKCLKVDYPVEYKQIMQSAKEFNAVWNGRRRTDDLWLTNTLTPTELTIAVLYDRKWSAKEIAEHLSISESRVRNHIRDIYEKLNVTSKKDFQNFMEH